MKRIDDDLHPWLSMEQNPKPEDMYGFFETWQNHQPQNPNPIPCQSPQLPLQNRFYQNPILRNPSSQNHLGLDSRLLINPGLGDPLQNYISLEEALARINLSPPTPSYHQSQFLEDSSRISSDLNRMRSMYASLGLLRANSNAFLDDLAYNNRADSRRSRRTPGDYRLGCLPAIRPNTHHYGLRAGSMRSIDDGANSRVYLSPLEGKHGSYYSALDLEQVKGKMVIVAKDQEGSRFLQRKIEEQNQTDMIFLELKDHVCDLIVDQFANGVIQKLFVISNDEQMTQLVFSLIKNEQRLLEICIHQLGTRGVQKLIERIKTPGQRFALISALEHITVSLSKNNNGHHVIQQCFKYFASNDTKCLLQEIANSCLEIAMDKSGCCVLQKSLTRAEGELKHRLLAEVTANALVLSENSYGNYVVQFVLEMKIPHAEDSTLDRLEGNFVTLSKNKYGSNVVEKCIKECSLNNSARVALELMHSNDFLEVVQDAFGNYVIQTALSVYKGDILYELARKIDYYYPFLHSHLHGKKVLAMLTRIRGNWSNRM